ncbi:hypothetical protein INR49_028117 [Caranx melampygus]|nr:hypothetical protein INR49_028117 [Caranx melampygus]
MEKLDSQASQVQLESNKEVIPRETHEDEMERMRCEVQQCKEFIHAQQQLLQKKAFEEDCASWLKNQFLNMTPLQTVGDVPHLMVKVPYRSFLQTFKSRTLARVQHHGRWR